jgi:hypothetical protein
MKRRVPVFALAGALVTLAYLALLFLIRHYADGQTANGLGG